MDLLHAQRHHRKQTWCPSAVQKLIDPPLGAIAEEEWMIFREAERPRQVGENL
jgi:hypothetical protein